VKTIPVNKAEKHADNIKLLGAQL